VSAPDLTERPTETFPVVQAGGLRFFRWMGHRALELLGGIGARVLFVGEIRRALREGRTWRR